MKKNLIIILGMLFLSTSFIFADDFDLFANEGANVSNEQTAIVNSTETSAYDFKNALGAFFLLTEDPIGGLEYQRWLNDKVGLTAQVSLFYNKYSYSNTTVFNYAFNLQTDISLYRFETKNFASNLYSWFLVGTNGAARTEEGKTYFSPNVILGAGFGFELIFWKHLSIPIQMGYVGAFPSSNYMNFSVGSGIRYKF